jgi:hypothetical protein
MVRTTVSFAYVCLACLRGSNCFARVSRCMLNCLFLLIIGKGIRMSSITGSGAGSQNWRKSRHSMANGNCVEVASIAATVVGVRDSAKPADFVLACPAAVWRSFIADAKAGKFDASC